MIDDTNPLVSIGIPTYNRPDSLRRTLQSITNQTYQNLEIIISDNASPDPRVEQVVGEFTAKDIRIRYYRQQENRGAFINFRFVMDEANGEYFMWLADDDWLDASYVSTCVEKLLNNPGHSLVCGGAIYYKDGQPHFTERPFDAKSNNSLFRVLKYYSHVTTNGTFYGVIRREELRKFVLPDVPVAGDWLIISALAFLGQIETVSSVAVHRDRGGASETIGIPSKGGPFAFIKRHTYWLVAETVFDDIRLSSTYDSLTKKSRWFLALNIFIIIMLRHSAPYLLSKLRKRIKMWKW